jgi:hypothetical protein
MHLGEQSIEDTDVVPVFQQMIGEMRSHEARATRDQNAHARALCNLCSTHR